MKKETMILGLIAIIQIFLIANSVTAYTYSISQTNQEELQYNISEDKIGKILKNGLGILVGFFSIKQIGMVSAYCCAVTTDGGTCQEVTSQDSCVSGFTPSSCEKYSECKTGCCYDSVEGVCTTKTAKTTCEKDGGIWDESNSCPMEECDKGCCIIGEEISFVTAKRCTLLSSLEGFNPDFRVGTTELDCLILKESQIEGACIFEGGLCEFLTEVECLKYGGDFFENLLCTHPSFESACTKQDSVGCVEGKDEIYWFDSCGNRENIYSSDKDSSWNNGSVLTKEQSCNSESSNINNENCGNCNRYKSSGCSATLSNQKSVKEGDYVCKDLTCTDETGKVRQNGESWCVYDSYIGDGKDTVGSRHWKRMCVEGEIIVEPCGDFRSQICVQAEGENNYGQKITVANCQNNEAYSCSQFNTEGGGVDSANCEKNPDCMVKQVHIADGFSFDSCVGKYPKGFDLSGKEYDSGNGVCSQATMTCIMIFKCGKCVKNCECKEQVFTDKMNDFCVSLGDCGSYINYVGDGTNNAKTSGGAPQPSWSSYVKYAKAVTGQYAIPKPLKLYYGAIKSTSGSISGEPEQKAEEAAAGGGMGAISGALGIAGMMAQSGAITGTFATMLSAGTIGMGIGGLIGGLMGLDAKGQMAANIGGLVGGIIGAKIGASMALNQGLTGQAAQAMAMKGALIGSIVVALIVALIMGLSKKCPPKPKKATFTCKRWQAPVGGTNCDLCNGDPLKPCSEYRCNSLGQACQLIGEDTEFPVCIKVGENDGAAPIISPLNITDGYMFVKDAENKYKVRTSDNECIPEFSLVGITLATDEYAQCLYDITKTDSYDEMENYFLESTSYTKEHSLLYMMPSLGSIEVHDETGDARQMFGQSDFYVRCQDGFGNVNTNEFMLDICVSTGEDITPPFMLAALPANNSYIQYNKTSVYSQFYFMEPSVCRYDYSDKDYSEMNSLMNCETDLLNYTDYGWECNTVLRNLNESVNTIYIRCSDKPWLDTLGGVYPNETKNINQESYVYVLKQSESNLTIEEISPFGDLDYGTEPMQVNLEVVTKGGAIDGEATCYYKFGENETYYQFYDTKETDVHLQEFDTITRGAYKVFVKCVDVAGNTVEGQTTFNLRVDSKPPVVVRTYHDGTRLTVITDEESVCYYDFNRCNFNFNSTKIMTTGYSRYHDTDWSNDNTYYIKCKDIFGNTNSQCAIVIKPSGGN